MSNNDGQSVLEALGGEAGCRRLATDFYARVAKTDELKPLFPGKSVRCATEEFAAFLIQFLDGDSEQTQYRWWLSLSESHVRFEISERQRSAWLGCMQQAIDSQIQDTHLRLALSQFFHSTSAYVVGKTDANITHAELSERWVNQRVLEQLIEHIVNGCDEEALACCPQFSLRRSVFVGILARMMQAGREPLITYVLKAVQQDIDLATYRFNGRTLLHFAAAASCLPVAQQLLADGMDADVLDNGGHAPLYRVPNSRGSEVDGAIVGALVQAGAEVNRRGGVNKSTALHQAARYGNIHAARALLNAGASVTLQDSKGFTPLDRAYNCRKHSVAAMLRGTDQRS